MASVHTDLDVHRFLYQATAQLAGVREPDKVLRHFMRACVEYFGADCATLAVFEVGMERAEALFAHPEGAATDLDLVTALLRNRQMPVPQGTVVARLERRGRPWAMIVLERTAGRFPGGSPRALAVVAAAVSDLVQRLDRERLSEVRARIDGKMMRELPPKDLYYQILDGLHQLTRYDHSAALWIWDPARSALELVAEQIAYRKGKSTLIGATVTLTPELVSLLGDGMVYGFDHGVSRWREWTDLGAVALGELLDSGGLGYPPRPAEGAMLCAALGTRQGPLGILKIAELHAGSFGEWERGIVERFTLLASIALQRAQKLETLQARVLNIERQNALAHLARGVAHDVNNALGEVIPLVQQIRADLGAGPVDPALLVDDLDRVETTLQVTRGIFSRMLRFARGSSRPGGAGDVRRALDATREILSDGLAKQGIRFTLALDGSLPVVRCGSSDLDRLFFNLMSNARDAMPGGGTLAVVAHCAGSNVEITIADTGAGMSPATLREIERPFFTTKEHGTGLGLSTCRSIVAEAGGEIVIESTLGGGTCVTLRLPIADGDVA